jgi:glycosyltransferase involved in cell wall biosynthesis
MMSLRVAIYTIALNEAQFADRWAKSTSDADYRLVADTGSSDTTVSDLRQAGVVVVPITVRPWRFDDARNAALALLPSDFDVVVSLDLDEVLVPEWRTRLEASWQDCTRLHYGYVWSWAGDKPDVVFHSDKIAGRHTHRWKHPVHEILTPTIAEQVNTCNEVLIEHRANPSKPRSQYLALLELAVREDPTDDRSSHYLGREYVFRGLYDKAIAEFNRHLSLPKATWDAERAASMRYLGKCHERLGDIQTARRWFLRATLEACTREALVDAATFELRHNRFHAVIDLCERALEAPKAVGSYLTERYAVEEGPYDLAAVAYYHLGQRAKAIGLAKIALDFNPLDARLRKNLSMMESV